MSGLYHYDFHLTSTISGYGYHTSVYNCYEMVQELVVYSRHEEMCKLALL